MLFCICNYLVLSFHMLLLVFMYWNIKQYLMFMSESFALFFLVCINIFNSTLCALFQKNKCESLSNRLNFSFFLASLMVT